MRRYDFRFHEVETVLKFSWGDVAANDGTTPIGPIGRLQRRSRLSCFAHSPDTFRRFQLVTDPPPKNTTLTRLRAAHKVVCQVDDQRLFRWFSKASKAPIARSITPGRKIAEFRQLFLSYPLPEVAKGQKFVIEEEFILPNRFDENEEFYSIEISELATLRTFKVVTEGIQITDARVVQTIGAAKESATRLPVEDDQSRYYFEYATKRAEPGSKITLKWHWNLDRKVGSNPVP